MRLRLAGLLVCVLVMTLQAHDLPRSESSITADGNDVHVQLRLNLLELRDARWSSGDAVSYQELESRIDELYASIKAHFRVDTSSRLLVTQLDRYELEDGHVLLLDLSLRFAQPVNALTVTSSLDQLMQPDHLHMTRVTLAGSVQQAVLDARAPRQEFVVRPEGAWATAWTFLQLGVRDVLSGDEHIALLVLLLIATDSARSLMKVIASFTVAHAITVALATFDLVILPTRVTGSLVALSIVFLAFENVIGGGGSHRWRVTALFGLAHGLGFANVLREMHLPRADFALSLFTFNSGVEIGQLMFMVVTFSLLKYAATVWRPLRPGVSAAVGSIAVYWFVERAFTG